MRTKQCLTLDDVKKMIAACEAEATKNKWAVAISVVDDGGFLLGFQRMDGAPAISAEVSMGKAKTSAMTKRPSKFFEDRIKERPAFAGFPAGARRSALGAFARIAVWARRTFGAGSPTPAARATAVAGDTAEGSGAAAATAAAGNEQPRLHGVFFVAAFFCGFTAHV